MNAFLIIQRIIEGNPPLNGHALGNIENIKSLASAKVEIEAMLHKRKS